jgi:hypothetical protein
MKTSIATYLESKDATDTNNKYSNQYKDYRVR